MTIRAMCDTFDVTPRTLRFYEAKELLSPIREGQKRLFTRRDRGRLKLILRGKRFGFTLEDIRQLLSLYGDKGRESAEVKAIAQSKLAEVKRKIEELQSLRDVLSHLVAHCHGDARPDCPILDELSGEATD